MRLLIALVFSLILNPLSALAAEHTGSATDGRVDAVAGGLKAVNAEVKTLKKQLAAASGDAEIDLLKTALARAGACIDSVSKLDVDAQEEAVKSCSTIVEQVKSALVDRHSKDPNFDRVPQTAVLLGGDLRLRMDPTTGRLSSLRYKREKNLPALAGTLDAPKLVPTVEDAAMSKDKVSNVVKYGLFPVLGGAILGTTMALAYPPSHMSGTNPDGSSRVETKSEVLPVVGGIVIGAGIGAIAGIVVDLIDDRD